MKVNVILSFFFLVLDKFLAIVDLDANGGALTQVMTYSVWLFVAYNACMRVPDTQRSQAFYHYRVVTLYFSSAIYFRAVQVVFEDCSLTSCF